MNTFARFGVAAYHDGDNPEVDFTNFVSAGSTDEVCDVALPIE